MQEKTFMVFSAQKILLNEFSRDPKLKTIGFQFMDIIGESKDKITQEKRVGSCLCGDTGFYKTFNYPYY